MFGIRLDDLPRVFERASDFEGIRFMDPLFLFQSKCLCYLSLDQNGRQDQKHVRLLELIVPEHVRELHEDAIAGEITERQLIKEIKLLRKICNIARVRRATKELGINPNELLPLDLLRGSELPLIRNFSASLKDSY